MRVAIYVHEVRRVDRGVDLGRTQAGMAEQFLQRAQVGATAEQMGGEAVPERVRRGPLRQAKRAPRLPHRAPDDLREAPTLLLGSDDNQASARPMVHDFLKANPEQRHRLWVRSNPFDGPYTLADLAAIMPARRGLAQTEVFSPAQPWRVVAADFADSGTGANKYCREQSVNAI